MTDKPQTQVDKFKQAARELETDDEVRFDEKMRQAAEAEARAGEAGVTSATERYLLAYGIEPTNIVEANEYDDSMFIHHTDADGKSWGLVIEFDETAVRETADFLRSRGVKVKRGRG